MKKSLPPVPNFPELEKKWLEYWEKNAINEQYRQKNNSAKKQFSFIDGPITANNPMGVHHGWGRSYKDLWQRFFNLQGYKQRFQNGFDCQGLWVEVEVEKALGLKNKKEIEELIPGDKKASIARFVELCKERVLKYAAIQTEQSKRLGYFMNWDNSYFTMSPENNYMIWHFLKRCHEKGWIYKGRDSVPWCPRCETAISQHEMLTEDYKEVTHKSVFFKLPIIDGAYKGYNLLVWTTTPWTIPANVAVAINTKYTYNLWEDTMTGEKYIFLFRGDTVEPAKREYKEKILSLQDWINYNAEGKKVADMQPQGNVDNAKLLGSKYTAPFDHLPRIQQARTENSTTFHTVIDGSEFIVATEGTGLLHVAPGAGQEDFKLGKKENLSVISVIGDNACYLDGMGEFTQQNAKDNPAIILKALKIQENGRYWFKTMSITHRYPACWRCKTELVWKVANEWYIAMDRVDPEDPKKRTFRQQMKDVAQTIQWIPIFGLDRELDWLNNMHDWLISKPNRYWGLALPIYECSCGTVEVIGSFEELKQRAIAGWEKFEGKTPHKPWIDEVIIECSACKKPVHRLPDVGNVWLDAGIVPYSTLLDPVTKKVSYTDDKTYWQEWFPADFITESFPGQFKNWFYALIAMSTALEQKTPFKTVLGFGTLSGEDGRPMHKSWGNSIEFQEGADKMGVDVMRWMYMRHDPKKNLLFGYKVAEEVKRQFHIPLWNIIKFYITYQELDQWKKTGLQYDSLSVLDQWALSRLNDTIQIVETTLKKYDVEAASESIERFVLDTSQWYIRLSRNRVWNNSDEAQDKNSFYSTLFYLLKRLVIIISPFLPFFAEELYQLLGGKKASVHLETWSGTEQKFIQNALENDMRLVRAMAEAVHSKRKEAGIKVRQPLSYSEILYPKTYLLKEQHNEAIYAQLLQTELNIKKIIFKPHTANLFDVQLNTEITEELAQEGKARDLIRFIQQQRKTLNCSISEYITLTIRQSLSPELIKHIKKTVLAKNIHINSQLTEEALITREH